MAFPYFAKLPLELQDIIWEFCILLDPPQTAHFALFKHVSILVPPPTRRPEIKEIFHLERLPHTVVDSRTTLLQTTSRSRAIALRHHDTATPTESALLKASTKSNQRPLPELRIDAATDLVILAEDSCRRAQRFSTAMMRPHLTYYPDMLRYLAVPWSPWDPSCPDDALQSLHGCISGLLRVYSTLHVLYVLVEPEVLQASKQPWPENMTWDTGITGTDIVSLDEYLAAYVEGDIHPGGFRSGNREYFEIQPEQILQLAGLESIICTLETFRNLTGSGRRSRALNIGRYRKEPVRLRLMSWKLV